MWMGMDERSPLVNSHGSDRSDSSGEKGYSGVWDESRSEH